MNIDKNFSSLQSRPVNLRKASIADADFIYSLRLDPKKNAYLSPPPSSIDDQKAWMTSVEKDPSQILFVIGDREQRNIGCVRIYNVSGSTFTWGSWILTDNAPPHAAVESSGLIYKYAIKCGLETANIDVRKGNESVFKFHLRFWGATVTHTTETDYFMVVSKPNMLKGLKKLKLHPYD